MTEYAIKLPGDRGVVTLPGADPGYEYPSGSLAIAAAIVGGMRHGDHFELARDGECIRTAKIVPPGEYELVAIGRLP